MPSLEPLKLFIQDGTEIVASLATLVIVLATIIGLLLVIFRPRGNVFESVLSVFAACFAAIILVRMVPPLVVASSLEAVRNSRSDAASLSAEINTWLWATPAGLDVTPQPTGEALILPPLFPPTETASPTATPFFVAQPTEAPTVAPTATPIVATPSVFLPTPAIVTRTP